MTGKGGVVPHVFRGLIVVEAVSTLLGAAFAFFAPELVVGSMVNGELGAQAEAVVSQAASAWVALALLLIGTLLLEPADDRVLRIILVPLLVGDLIHIAAIAWLIAGHGSWTSGVIGLVAYTLCFFGYRAALVVRPAWLLGSNKSPLCRRVDRREVA